MKCHYESAKYCIAAANKKICFCSFRIIIVIIIITSHIYNSSTVDLHVSVPLWAGTVDLHVIHTSVGGYGRPPRIRTSVGGYGRPPRIRTSVGGSCYSLASPRFSHNWSSKLLPSFLFNNSM